MNFQPEVDAFFDGFEHPLKAEMMQVRAIILGTNPRMTETIKWGAPTFVYKGNLATFNVRAKKFVNLTFHTGAHIPDEAGILEGDGKAARVIRFADATDIEVRRADLEAVVRAWIALKES